MIVKITYFKQVLKICEDMILQTRLSQSCQSGQEKKTFQSAGAEDLRRVLQLLLLRAHQGDFEFEFEGFEESIELVIGRSFSSQQLSG